MVSVEEALLRASVKLPSARLVVPLVVPSHEIEAPGSAPPVWASMTRPVIFCAIPASGNSNNASMVDIIVFMLSAD